jgi:hypothetical protein
MGKEIIQPKLLLVEGRDEAELFDKLLTDLEIAEVGIWRVGGRSKFRPRLEALTKYSGFDQVISIGIVRDADNDPSSAFDSICGALENAGLSRPAAPLQPVGNDPQIVVMVLPGEDTPGMLEDVCLESVSDDPAMSCVNQFFQCLEEHLDNLPRNPSKAMVRAFLASREWIEIGIFEYLQSCLENYLPNLPQVSSVAQAHTFLASRYKPKLDLGIAAKEGYWNLDHPAFTPMKHFLNTL